MGNVCSNAASINTKNHPNNTTQTQQPTKRSTSVPSNTTTLNNTIWSRMRPSTSSKRETVKFDDHALHEQAIAAATAIILQQQQNGSLPFDRSTSLRYPPFSKKYKEVNFLPRSSSSRPRSSSDTLLPSHHLLNQDAKPAGLLTCHFVLVHGGGFGAWCWYKTIALLQESGFKVTAIDLAGSGIHSFDTNGVTDLSQYVKPLTNFLEKLADGEKVILVGHDFGGACIAYTMELFPSKVSKAVFVAAIMLKDGQSALDIFSQQADPKDKLQQAQIFLYANGSNRPPTAIDLDKTLLKELLFNQTPTKDIALASVLMRPLPFAPVLQKISLSTDNYGSIRRFYIQTTDDNAMPATVQELMIKASPPEQVFRLKGADHSPFFSKPQALHKYLVEIANIH